MTDTMQAPAWYRFYARARGVDGFSMKVEGHVQAHTDAQAFNQVSDHIEKHFPGMEVKYSTVKRLKGKPRKR